MLLNKIRGLLLLSFLILISDAALAQRNSPITISLADTNSFGYISLHNFDGWQFSYDEPDEIKDQRNLKNAIPVDIRNLDDIKADSRWRNYGWFELEIIADSSIAGFPRKLSYQGHEPIKIWLNGVEVFKNGNPTKNADKEVLSRFLNKVQTGIILRPGSNYFLIEYSDHTIPTYFTYGKWFNNGLFLTLYSNYEIYLRRHRAFIFGGALMLLLLVVLIHTYLAFKFKGQYHTYVSLTAFFMLLLAFVTLSDTLFDWSYSYIYFFEFGYDIFLVLIAYFFLISVRMIFALSIPWRTLTVLCILFICLGITSSFINRNWLNVIHPTLLIATLIYVFFSLRETKKNNPDSKIWIISIGIIGTVVGSILYTLAYFASGEHIHWLFITSVILSFVGIPVSLTFHVAKSYASLISTLEHKVLERTTDLESANEYQKRFFANISHEFRTPLTISGGLVDKLLKEKETDPTKLQYSLSVVKRNMLRLDDMVNQIIDLTKSDQNHLALNKKYYKADNLTSISVESFRSLAEYHGHSFEFYPDAENAILFADRSKVEIMINNLISNAVKFTPDGGSIQITTSIEGNTFVLKVQDTGPGIPEGEEEIIFERFHRIKRDDVDYVEGMGVGLELSRALARLHNGNIEAIPNLKVGSCFKLELPIEQIKAGEVTPIVDELEDEIILSSSSEKQVIENASFNILLVEDNQDMMDYISDTLSNLGNIKKAKNGKEALNLLDSFTPDIIITDLMMPVMGGQELVANLFQHSKWNQIPVVVLTAKALEEDKLNLLRIGVVDYITKPFLPEQLVLKTKNLLTYYTRRKKLKLSITTETPESEPDFSKKVGEFVSKNMSNSQLSVDMMAEEFSQSRRSFYRNLQLETGMTPAEFIREIRLTTAQSLIAKNKNLRLEELANAVGYKSATSFRKVYEERFGKHPLG